MMMKKIVLSLLMVGIGWNDSNGGSLYGCWAFAPSVSRSTGSSTRILSLSEEQEVLLVEKLPMELKEHECESAVDDWKACVDLLESYNVQEAEWMLAEAFGWVRWMKVTSTIARKYMAQPILPSVSELQSAMDWMTTHNLNVPHVIATSPESYLKEPHKTFQKVSSCAPRTYRDKDALLELLQTDAKAIQNTYNCDGDSCASECGSCWVTYQRNNPQWS